MLKFLDIIIALFFSIFIIFLVCSFSLKKNGKKFVKIICLNKEYIYPLDKERKLEFFGYIGKAVVLIKNSSVDVLSDPSEKQICVNQDPINNINDFLVCLPNKIFISIIGKGENKIDSISF